MMEVDAELFKGICITSRVRLARNLFSYPFTVRDEKMGMEIVKKVQKAVDDCGNFKLYKINELDEKMLYSLKEKHLISQNLIDNKVCGYALIDGDNTLSIMVNEEDVIREQCFDDGLSLKEAYSRLTYLDDQLSKRLSFAFDKQFGYLTACATNLGTGLRASVMMFLPALTESNKIEELVDEIKKLGLTVRGLYGEGSDAEGCIYQISNEVTLGKTENEIIESVEKAVIRICLAERDEMERLYLTDQLKTTDRASKCYGILTNAILLTFSDYLKYISQVKMGAMMGVFDIADIDEIDRLTVEVRPYTLRSGLRSLTSFKEDLKRAEIVKDRLLKLKGN